MKVLLLTNGTLVDEDVASQLIETGVDRIQVSLDGPDAASNDAVRGEGVYDKVLATLELLRGSRIDLFLAMLPVPGVSFEPMRQKGPVFAAALKRRFGSQLTICVSQGILEGREVPAQEGIDFIRHCRSIQNSVSGRDMISSLDLWQWEPRRKNMSCGYGQQLAVEPDGTVNACAAGQQVADVRESTLKEATCALREAARTHLVDALPECSGCSIRYLCGGPCRVSPVECTDDFRQDILRRLVKSNGIRYELGA